MRPTVRKAEIKGRLLALSAWELMQAGREAATLAPAGDGAGLCFNACVIARSLYHRRRPVFRSGAQALQMLTPELLAELTQRYLARYGSKAAATAEAVNPSFDEKRFQELKGR